jgi:hypothetical protein
VFAIMENERVRSFELRAIQLGHLGRLRSVPVFHIVRSRWQESLQQSAYQMDLAFAKKRRKKIKKKKDKIRY